MNRGAQLLTVHVKAFGGQTALAKALGVDQGNLSRYERGEATPGLKTRLRFEDQCGIPMRSWDDPPLAANDEPDTIVDAPKGAA